MTDDEAMDAVVSSAIRDDLMSGLPSQGYEGLALWPEGLRHPYSFGQPILTLSDFDDLSILAPVSKASFDLLQALGAIHMTSVTLVKMTMLRSPGSGPLPTSTVRAW